MATGISVIIPCYNHAHYIQRCVNSILQQHSNIEIIIVDDGSRDDSVKVVKNLPVAIKLLQQENSGPSAARNNGLAHASGKYIAFLDADNIWFNNFASYLLNALEVSGPDVALVGCGWQRIGLDDTFMRDPVRISEKSLKWPHLILSNPIDTGAALIKKDAIERVGGMDESLIGIEDWDLWIRLVAEGYQLSCINDVLFGYRTVPNSISRNVEGMFNNCIKLLDKTFSQIPLPPVVYTYRDKSYAWRYLDACAGFYENHDDEKAEKFFRNGVSIWPELLTDQHTLYTLVCARQPILYKTTQYFLDLEEAEQRTKKLIMNFRVTHPNKFNASLGELYNVLSYMAFVQQNCELTRRFAINAIRSHPRSQLINGLKKIIKSYRLSR